MPPKGKFNFLKYNTMKRHKWRKGALPQLCERCGIIRSRETRKYKMAITNHPPYDHYKYETVMVYQSPDKKYDKAPSCILKN